MNNQEMYEEALWNTMYHRIPLEDKLTQGAMKNIRDASHVFLTAIYVNGNKDRPREQQMAYRAVEDAVMYAIAGLARGRTT